MEITNQFLIAENKPAFQMFFESNNELLKPLNLTVKDLKSDKYFSDVGGTWKEQFLQKTQFFKIRLFSEDFIGFKFPDFFGDILFIGRLESKGDYERFNILDVGYFDVELPFFEADFFVYIGSSENQQLEGNTLNFNQNVRDKWKNQTAFKIGNRKVFDENRIQKLKNRLDDLYQKIEKARHSKDLDELKKLQNKLDQLSETVENQTFKSESKSGNRVNLTQNSLVWNGQNIEDFGVDSTDFYSFEDFKEAVIKANFPENAIFNKTLTPKDQEFETENEFQRRKVKFELEKKQFDLNYKKEREKNISNFLSSKNLLNSYLSSQKVETKYNPENEEFAVSVENRIFIQNFNIQIPRNIAREFKQQVTNFDFNFTQDLVLNSISVNFQNQVFYAKDFQKRNLVEFEKEKEKEKEREREISSKTVKVNNLMFQDFDLPNPMNWKNACDYCEKLKLLGFNDWRLPELGELKIAYKNTSKFKNIEYDWYWSNTTFEIYGSYSWILTFNNGGNYYAYQSNDFFVRCVR